MKGKEKDNPKIQMQSLHLDAFNSITFQKSHSTPKHSKPPSISFLTSIMASSSSPAPKPSNRQPKHIVICGGGVIGACTAYFLSESKPPSPSLPLKITVVERSSIAAAASGKAGGFLALDWCDSSPPLSFLARASFALHRSLSCFLDGPLSYGYRPLTTLSLPISSKKSNLSPSSLPSWIDGAVEGPPRPIGTTETTAQVHPQLFTRKLMEVAKSRGVEVVIGVVEGVEFDEGGGEVTGVTVRGGGGGGGEVRVLEADAVVLALGPWSGRSKVVSSLFRVTGTKAHSIVVRPREPAAISAHALFLSYRELPGAKVFDPEVYPRPTGEVYICGMSSEAEVPDNPEEITSDPTSIQMLHKIAGRVSTHLTQDKGAEVVAEQACFLPCTEDGLPVIGEIPGIKNCFVATGHSCWGILNGPATGAALAELILHGKSTTVDLTPFSPSRFLCKRK